MDGELLVVALAYRVHLLARGGGCHPLVADLDTAAGVHGHVLAGAVDHGLGRAGGERNPGTCRERNDRDDEKSDLLELHGFFPFLCGFC